MEEKNNKLSLIFQKVLFTCIFLVVLVLVFFVGRLSVKFQIGNSANVLGVNKDTLDKYSTLFEVRNEIYKRYDGNIDEDALVEGAAKGLADALGDPYTLYMNNKEYKDYMESNSGKFVGVGIYISSKDNQVVVSSPIAGGPAEKVGILAGDVIYAVDGNLIDGDSEKATSLLTGEEGTNVKVTVFRNGSEYIDYDIKRSVIKTSSVSGEMVDGDIGYISLSTFDQDVSKDFDSKLKEFKNQGMKGLILDLRSNGGGYLSEAVKIASEFIPEKETITYTVDKYDKKQVYESVGGLETNLPVVILTDKNSASASEVVTGALKDYNIAVSVGKTTFGKGIVQLPFELASGNGGMKITVSKYYTPNGKNIHGTGISPDYDVDLDKDKLGETYDKNNDTQFLKALEVIKDKVD